MRSVSYFEGEPLWIPPNVSISEYCMLNDAFYIRVKQSSGERHIEIKLDEVINNAAISGVSNKNMLESILDLYSQLDDYESVGRAQDAFADRARAQDAIELLEKPIQIDEMLDLTESPALNEFICSLKIGGDSV